MNEQELQRLLASESNSVEWKAGGDPEKIVKTLAAFANDYQESGGGFVVCGVEEQTDASGLTTPKLVGITVLASRKLKNRIFELSMSRVTPPIAPEFESISLGPDTEALVIWTGASSEIHPFKNVVVVRLGDKVTNASTNLHSDLAHRKDHIDWLDQPCAEATLDDIDYFALEEISKQAKQVGDPREFLQPGVRMFASTPPLTSRIAGPNGERVVPNRFAMLLTGKAPQLFLAGAFVMVTRFRGVTRAVTEFTNNELIGPIPWLISQVMGILDSEASVITDKSQDFKNGGQNRKRYSRQALLEILVNALAHRDYRDPHATKIYVFEDRIEFESPGGLVGTTSLEEAKRGRTRWRNRSLARYLTELKRKGLYELPLAS